MPTLEAITPMARRTAPPSEFQKWLSESLTRTEMDLAELARRVGSDYSHLWKIARGDPSKYPTSRRPGYELTERIGVVLGDKPGALVAAGYWHPADEQGAEPLSAKGKIRVIGEDGQEVPLSDAMRRFIESTLSAFPEHTGQGESPEGSEVGGLPTRTDHEQEAV